MVGWWKVLFFLLVLQIVHCRRSRKNRNKNNSTQNGSQRPLWVNEYIDAAVEAKEGDHPYLVQLRDGRTGEHFCGGSILSKYLVITAASCVYNQSEAGSLDGIEVVAGEHDRNEISGHEQVRHIRQVFIHESYIYSKHARDNDIALLVIQPEFDLNDFVQIIPMASNATPTGVAVLSGWGSMHMYDTDAVQVLHSLNLTVYNDSECKQNWEDRLRHELGRDVDMTRILCARNNYKGRPSTKLTACDGDAGSPLTCTHSTNHTSGRFLCGITSGADESCGLQAGGKPGVFANVREFTPWITEKLNQVEMKYNCPCDYFRCNNAHCVNPKSLNDGVDDCGDESDETPGIRDLFNNTETMSKPWDVEDTKYKCHYSRTDPSRFRLISSKHVCDGVFDCPGNSQDICDNFKTNPSMCPNSFKNVTQNHTEILNCKHISDEDNCPAPLHSFQTSGRAVSVLMAGPAGGNISGVIELRQEGSDSLVLITGQVRGLLPNSTHGFHIHQSGDFRNTQNPCVSTGGHYNPLSSVHGAPGQTARHVGDLGNIHADENGVAIVNITDTVVSLIGPNSVIGRAFVVHEKVDDLGVNEGESKKTGNAGSRIACGIIGTIYEKPLEVR